MPVHIVGLIQTRPLSCVLHAIQRPPLQSSHSCVSPIRFPLACQLKVWNYNWPFPRCKLRIRLPARPTVLAHARCRAVMFAPPLPHISYTGINISPQDPSPIPALQSLHLPSYPSVSTHAPPLPLAICYRQYPLPRSHLPVHPSVPALTSAPLHGLVPFRQLRSSYSCRQTTQSHWK